MSDVAISYSSLQRPAALRFAGQLRAAGCTVWLDDAAEVKDSLSAVGVPPGQPHWSTIARAIDDALVLLVLDCPEWRASSYCSREYAHARARGKPVAVIPVGAPSSALTDCAPVATWEVDDIEGLAEGIRTEGQLLSAHARLLRGHLNDDRGSNTQRLWRLPLARLVADAEKVLGSSDHHTGIEITDEIVAFSGRVQRAHRRRQRAVIAVGSAALVLIAALASAALVARSSALESERAATEAAATQQSLQVAAEALRAESTAAAQELASQALQLAPTDVAVAASRQIAADAVARRRLRLDEPVAAVAISDDGTVAVFGVSHRSSGHQLVVIDVERGVETVRMEVPEGFHGRFLELLPDAEQLVFVGSDTGALLVADLTSGSFRSAQVDDFTALALDGQGGLWWTTQEGRILRSPSPNRVSDAVEIAAVGARPTAIAVHASEAGFDVLLEGEQALVFERQLGTDERADYRPVSERRLFEDFEVGVPLSDRAATVAPDRLMRCGKSLVAIRAGRAAVATPTETFPVVGPASSSLLMRGTHLTGHACVADAVVAVQFRGRPKILPEHHWVPPELLVPSEAAGASVLATSRSGEHLVFSRASGLIDIIRLSATSRSVPVDSAFVVAPLENLLLLIDHDGGVRSFTPDGDPHRELGRLASPPRPSRPLLLGSAAVLGTRTGIALLDANGIRAELDLGSEIDWVQRYGDAGVIAAGPRSLFVIEDVNEPANPVAVELQDVEDTEHFLALAVGPHGIAYLATNLGRLLSVDVEEGRVKRSVNSTPALAETGLAVLLDHPDGLRVVTHGNDSILRVFDPELELLEHVLTSGSGRTLQPAPDGQTILAGTVQGHILLLDALTLETIQRLAMDRFHARSYLFSKSGERVYGIELVQPSSTDSGGANRLDVLPVRQSLAVPNPASASASASASAEAMLGHATMPR
jgi:hypothetical protein